MGWQLLSPKNGKPAGNLSPERQTRLGLRFGRLIVGAHLTLPLAYFHQITTGFKGSFPPLKGKLPLKFLEQS
jgi:hypothetical protein